MMLKLNNSGGMLHQHIIMGRLALNVAKNLKEAKTVLFDRNGDNYHRVYRDCQDIPYISRSSLGFIG